MNTAPDPGTEVYVSALHRTGLAVVVRVRRDGRAVVRFGNGDTAKVRPDQMSLASPPRRKGPPPIEVIGVPGWVGPPIATYPSDLARAVLAQPKPSTPRDRAYLDWLRLQPCVACAFPHGCDPSHHGRHGLGIKASDHDAVSMCRRCHDHWEVGAPRRVFGLDHLNDDATDEWLRDRAREQRAAYLRHKERANA